jgi:hypothetical protein
MRRALVTGVLCGALGAVSVAPAVAQDEPIREPLVGVCLRPLIGKILNLPLIDIPDQPIPKEPIALTLGGQYKDCHP